MRQITLAVSAMALLILTFPVSAKVMQSMPIINPTRGERNNNPGNIRFNSSFTWQGQAGKDSGGYLIFDTVENGIRAIGKDLLTKFSRGLNTVRKIISVYAPSFENDTESYIRAVSSAMGVDDSETFNLYSASQLRTFVVAIIRHENGRVNFSTAQIDAGIERALT